MKTEPNQSLVPTTTAVTSPAAVAAHLKRSAKIEMNLKLHRVKFIALAILTIGILSVATNHFTQHAYLIDAYEQRLGLSSASKKIDVVYNGNLAELKKSTPLLRIIVLEYCIFFIVAGLTYESFQRSLLRNKKQAKALETNQ